MKSKKSAVPRVPEISRPSPEVLKIEITKLKEIAWSWVYNRQHCLDLPTLGRVGFGSVVLIPRDDRSMRDGYVGIVTGITLDNNNCLRSVDVSPIWLTEEGGIILQNGGGIGIVPFRVVGEIDPYTVATLIAESPESIFSVDEAFHTMLPHILQGPVEWQSEI